MPVSVLPELSSQHETPGCWVCGCTRARAFKPRSLLRALEPDDLNITDARYGSTLALSQCQACGFVYAVDPMLDDLNGLYERLHDPDYEHTQESRGHQMRRLLRVILHLHPHAKRLLDIGAGAGALVRHACDLGLDAIGVEPSVSHVESGARINRVHLLQGRFPHPALERRQFDIITMIDVIEHVTEPVDLLRHAADALTPGGMLVVVTPDLGSVAARFLKHRWWHFRLAHVGYFNRETLLRAADRASLRAVDIRRPRSYFTVEYILARLGCYLPLGTLNRFVRGRPAASWLRGQIIPINPHDSLAAFLRKRELATRDSDG
jgi:2-polyprenyl-3-methyl-5-hydroxy-6-metoxy-1,4-benzoquinol methylase